jgi:hypothetical protein
MKITGSIINIIKKISSISAAGGLSVSDSVIRYFRMEEGRPISASLRLPPGIVEEGKIKNKELAIAAFKDIRAMISSGGKPPEVVVTLESGVVYSQFFTLPQLEASGIKEAAELNIQMISPVNISQAYYGYQLIGESPGGIGYDFLGGFIPSSIINDWVSVFKAADIVPVVVEFQSLSLVRAAVVSGGLDKRVASLVIDVSSEGLDIMIVKNGNLYFDYFYPWKNIQGEDRSISFDKFKQTLSAEVGKVMNFSLSRFGSEVKKIFVNAEGIGDKVVSSIKGQFPGAEISLLTLGDTNLPPSWAACFGASLRGAMSRSEDDLISLSPLTVIEEYGRNQIINMISLWGRVFAGVLIFLVFIVGAGDLLLRRVRLDLDSQTVRGLSGNELSEFGRLSLEATEFNKQVALVGEAKRGEGGISPFVERISGLSSEVRLTRLSVQSIISPVSINGTASSADAVSRFHRQLAALKGVSDIQFPLSSLISTPDGRTSFTMSFKVQSFDL